MAHLFHGDGHPIFGGFEHHLLKIGYGLYVTATADKLLVACHFQDAAAHVLVGFPHCFHDVLQWYPQRGQLVGVQADLVFTLIAAYRSHFGNPFHSFQGIAQVEILQRAQVRKVVVAGGVPQRILINPAHTGGVRPQGGIDAFRQIGGGAVEILQHPGAGPVHIDAVVEDHIDERQSEKALAPDVIHPGRSQQRCGQWVGNLVLHQVGAAARPLGKDDHLHVREIRNGVQRRQPEGLPAADGEREDSDHCQQRVTGAVADNPLQPANGFAFSGWVSGRILVAVIYHCSSPAFRRLSDAIRKLPEVTTRSPASMPSRISTTPPAR